MSISASLLPEFDHEMATTRRTLERVPDGLFAWKPHDKSYTMGQLAGHLSNIPSWVPFTLEQDSLDLAPGGLPMKFDYPTTAAGLLKAFDEGVKAARASLEKTSDATMMQSWSLLGNGQVYFTQPKVAVLRGFVMNHSIHHRAQLGVYLRLNNIAHPSMYGPSADETGM